MKETLETMGASILIGGFTTFLAVVPIAGSSATMLMTVFKAFFAMVALGVTHGLILLPVVLSLVGPTTNVRHLGSGENDEQMGSDKDLSVPANATFNTQPSKMSDDDDESSDIQSMTHSVVQEVCETNEIIEGSPKREKGIIKIGG